MMTDYAKLVSRRLFLRGSVAAGVVTAVPFAAMADQVSSETRSLAVRSIHTNESARVVYHANGDYIPDAVAELSHVLRCRRSGESTTMDPALFDLLHKLQSKVGNTSEFQVISGYRSPASNAKMAAQGRGVAKKSLHMQGRAIDIRLPGTSLDDLHAAASSLKLGGVGKYTKSDFIHVDTGRVRYWGA